MVRIGSCPECQKEVALTKAIALDDEAQVQCPHCEVEFPRRRLVLRDVPELIPEKVPDTFSGDLIVEEPTRGAAKGELSPIDLPVVTSAPSPQDSDARIRTAPRGISADRSSSFVRQLVGIVGGGMVGLVLGYFILLWIGGPQKDFLEIGRRLPPWTVPAEFHPAVLPPPIDPEAGERSLADLIESMEEEKSLTTPDFPPEGLPPEPAPGGPVPSTDLDVREVAVIDPPQLTTSDLDAAFQAASDARLSLVAGEVSDPSALPVKAAAYKAFAALAEALTFAPATLGRESEHTTLAKQAEQLLQETLVDERMKGQLGRLTQQWIDAPTRESEGVIVSGPVIGSHIGIEGQRGILIELAGTGRALAVVGPQDIDTPRGEQVVVVGALISKPQQRIRGYTGSAAEVVWAGRVLQSR